MKKILKLKLFFTIFLLFYFVFSGQKVFAIIESPSNPIYDPVATAEKAYYPSVIKMSDNDYRMWYQTNSTPSNTTIGYATSVDGLSWTMITNAVSGLIPDNAGHPHVEFFDGKFEIWYWNAATPYGNNAMHHAESVDGIAWTNDSAITGDLTAASGWNAGIYGASDVIFNGAPTNTGTNPFDYKYAMYYDATSGGYEQIALGYSADGVAWTLYGTGPVLEKGAVGSWDSGYIAIGSTVIKGNFWTMWYSGGISASNEGIGCATSVDGLVWTKCPNNPIMAKTDGVSWRNNRTYTPSVIKEDNTYKMWFTGRDSTTSNYAIGYATLNVFEAGRLYLQTQSSGAVTLPPNTDRIVLDNYDVLDLANNVTTSSGGEIVIAGVTKNLSSFTSGDLVGVDLSVPRSVGGKQVSIGRAIRIFSGLMDVPTSLINSTLSTVSVSIPDSTSILAPNEWDGLINPPETISSSGDTPPAGFSIGMAVDIGSPDAVLLFDKPVLVTLNGVAGSVGYKPAGLTTWTQITTTCGGSYDAPTLSADAFPGECSITNGTDTKILTYHLTTFGGLIENTATLTLVKTIVGGNRTFTDFPLTATGPITITGDSASSTVTVATVNAGTYTLSEVTQLDYTLGEWSCIKNTDSAVIGSSITLASGDSAICTIQNTYITPIAPSGGGGGSNSYLISKLVAPLINVVKVPSPLSLPAGPGLIKYTYTVSNIGIVPMNNVSVVDNSCSPLVKISGDIAILQVNEKWTYTCFSNITGTKTNIVTATGWANGISSIDIANVTVVVGAPIVSPLIKVTETPSPLVLPAGGGMVTYTNKITNLGIAPLDNIQLVGDKCISVKYISGDTNGDLKLDSSETWVYTCSINLTKTTTNTIVATGKVNGLDARDFAIVTVVVAVPGFPETGPINITDFGQQVKTISDTLLKGNSGSNVKILQQFLISQNKGPAAQALANNGTTTYFGILTKAALAEFQLSTGINPPLGNFGPITRAYLKLNY